MISYTTPFFLHSDDEKFEASLNVTRYPNSSVEEEAHLFLQNEEQLLLQSFTHEKKKRSYLLGRYSVKKGASSILREGNLREILVRNGVFNQPLISTPANYPLLVTLAHSHDLAVSVVYDDRLLLGVDLEKFDTNAIKALEEEATTHERCLAQDVSYGYEDALFMIWTMKEALAKALKTGLTLPLQIMEVKSLETEDGIRRGTFTNFVQYAAISFRLEDYFLSFVYPKNLLLKFDIQFIQQQIIEKIF